MREIKFRGLGIDGKWWFGESNPIGANHVNLATFFANLYTGAIRPETSGEWAGCHDKNGKEIYEGDKLQFAAEDEGNIWILVVQWSGEMLSWCLYDDKDDKEPLELLSDQIGADMEVTSNIYENPELLEAK